MSGDVRNADHPATALRQAVGVVGVVQTSSGAGQASTSVVTRVATNVASVTLKALNANRLGLTIENHATSSLFVKLGAVASLGAGTESFTAEIFPDGYYEVPFGYTGVVDGIWDAADATGEALVTELTA